MAAKLRAVCALVFFALTTMSAAAYMLQLDVFQSNQDPIHQWGTAIGFYVLLFALWMGFTFIAGPSFKVPGWVGCAISKNTAVNLIVFLVLVSLYFCVIKYQNISIAKYWLEGFPAGFAALAALSILVIQEELLLNTATLSVFQALVPLPFARAATALLFGVHHLILLGGGELFSPRFIFVVALAFILGTIRIQTRGVVVPILLHLVWSISASGMNRLIGY